MVNPLPAQELRNKVFSVANYNLAATLSSGQAFRWRAFDSGWAGVIRSRWVQLRSDEFTLTAETAVAVEDWQWLVEYLQLDLDLIKVLQTFPDDAPMRVALETCRGLRLLRQDPWEC